MMLRRSAPEAAARLIALEDSKTESVSLSAVKSHLEWAIGKPKETVAIEGDSRPTFLFLNLYRPPGYDPLAQPGGDETGLDAGAVERKALGP